MFPAVVVPTAVVLIAKFADDKFAGIVTELGTDAAKLAFDRVMAVPPDGAGAVRFTVPVALCPPVTLEGFSTRELKVGSEMRLNMRVLRR
jgi:hypothetical protein